MRSVQIILDSDAPSQSTPLFLFRGSSQLTTNQLPHTTSESTIISTQRTVSLFMFYLVVTQFSLKSSTLDLSELMLLLVLRNSVYFYADHSPISGDKRRKRNQDSHFGRSH